MHRGKKCGCVELPDESTAAASPPTAAARSVGPWDSDLRSPAAEPCFVPLYRDGAYLSRDACHDGGAGGERRPGGLR